MSKRKSPMTKQVVAVPTPAPGAQDVAPQLSDNQQSSASAAVPVGTAPLDPRQPSQDPPAMTGEQLQAYLSKLANPEEAPVPQAVEADPNHNRMPLAQGDMGEVAAQARKPRAAMQLPNGAVRCDW